VVQRIIRQPDGLYAVFSSIVDGFILRGATEEEIIQWRAEEAASHAREQAELEMERVKHQDKPYHELTLTWDEAYATDLRNYPPETENPVT
jgi:hypothetical protein